MSSTKKHDGASLRASGAIELIAITLAVRDGVIPPTINYETADPACDLDCVPNTARECTASSVLLSTSFGFGGHNCCLAVGARGELDNPTAILSRSQRKDASQDLGVGRDGFPPAGISCDRRR